MLCAKHFTHSAISPVPKVIFKKSLLIVVHLKISPCFKGFKQTAGGSCSGAYRPCSEAGCHWVASLPIAHKQANWQGGLLLSQHTHSRAVGGRLGDAPARGCCIEERVGSGEARAFLGYIARAGRAVQIHPLLGCGILSPAPKMPSLPGVPVCCAAQLSSLPPVRLSYALL